ncbi:MAG: UvrB/UvrC motif-containing protein [Treponema sp.]
MLCDFCHKREAVFFIEQTGKTFRKKINICMECAVKHGLSPDPQKIQRSIGSLFEEISQAEKAGNPEENRLCPVCGRSLAAIRRTGRTGCPECWEIFKSELSSILSERGISGPYTGSMPRRVGSFRSVLTDRMDIETKLEESVKNEDYEKAAVYRDYLRALEKRPVSDGGTSEKRPQSNG